uniref:Secreted protein n=1 Tax=Noccaea caerulescens TaxID=107243 RepID=A0A1J3J8L7_NOCCA
MLQVIIYPMLMMISLSLLGSLEQNHLLKLSHDTTTVLPFVKHSPVWKVFESMEVFRSVKQSPHFSPLLESREEFRQGLAVCEMVKYCGLLERVENMQPQKHTREA